MSEVTTTATHPITVIIPTHNHARYLTGAISSARAAGAADVHVVDDSSTDDPQAVCSRLGVTCDRIEARSVHAARMHGLARVVTPYVMFLDADNEVLPEYFAEAIEQLRGDHRLAGVYPHMQQFGDSSMIASGERLAFVATTTADLERENCADAGTVWRTDVIRQTGLASRRIELHTHEDWLLAREVVRNGWRLSVGRVPLRYRVAAGSLLTQQMAGEWYNRAGLAHETVTIFVPLCGRWHLWPRMREWLLAQTWPRDKTRVLICDNSHSTGSGPGSSARPNFAADLDAERPFAGISVYRHGTGEPGLAEQARGVTDNTRRVNTVVASIYNRAFAREISTEYTLILEDDVFPEDRDIIERMLREIRHDIACVAVPYAHRDHDGHLCCWMRNAPRDNANGHPRLQRRDTMPREPGPMGGSGFGCLLVRMAAARELFPVHANGEGVIFYDVEFFERIEAASRKAGSRWRAWMLWDRWAEHVTGGGRMARTSR